MISMMKLLKVVSVDSNPSMIESSSDIFHWILLQGSYSLKQFDISDQTTFFKQCVLDLFSYILNPGLRPGFQKLSFPMDSF